MTHFAEHAVQTGVTDSDRASWLEARRSMVTASVSSALLGVNPFSSALDVYADFVLPREVSAEPNDEKLMITSPAFWGKRLELAIAHIVADYYSWEVQDGGELLQSRAHPTLGATLDAEVSAGKNGAWGVYEGKTTSVWRAGEWKDDDVPPDFVYVQQQHQLLVTKASYGITFVLIGGQTPKLYELEPDEQIQSLLVELSEEFMERVRALDPPPPSAKSAASILRIYPTSSGDANELSSEIAVALPPEAVEWTREYFEAQRVLKEAENKKKLLGNHLKMCLKNKTYGVLPEMVDGKRLWRWLEEGKMGRLLRPLKGHQADVELHQHLPLALPPHPFDTLTKERD